MQRSPSRVRRRTKSLFVFVGMNGDPRCRFEARSGAGRFARRYVPMPDAERSAARVGAPLGIGPTQGPRSQNARRSRLLLTSRKRSRGRCAMSLTLGGGPLGHHPDGHFNFTVEGPKHRIFFEDYPRRMRAVLGGETVIDTVRGKLLFESSLPPVLYVPLDDVRQELLSPTGHTSHCPFKGDAAYWTVDAGGETAENVLWGYPE